MQRPAHQILIGAFSSPEEAEVEMRHCCSLWHSGFGTGALNLPFSISQPQKAQSLRCKIPDLLQDKLCAKQMPASTLSLQSCMCSYVSSDEEIQALLPWYG